MPQKVKKDGLLSAEEAAEKWSDELYGRLQYENTNRWRDNIVVLLQEEYSRLRGTTVDGGTMGVPTVWEYYQLVLATNKYLRFTQDTGLASGFFEWVVRDLTYLNRCLSQLPFDPQEKDSMRQAFERMMPVIRKWEEK